MSENNIIFMTGPGNQGKSQGFKDNLDRAQRVDYYNKNTEILKQMIDQMEADNRLGEEFRFHPRRRRLGEQPGV